MLTYEKCHDLQAAYCYLLGQIGDALEVMPGEEFRVALQEAAKVALSPVALLSTAKSHSLRDKL